MPGRSTLLLVLKLLLWFVCISHITLGGAIMWSSSVQQRIADLYGARVDWNPQFVYILRPLGVFMVALGAAGLAAAWNPMRYRFLTYCFAGVLLARVVQRVLYRDEIADAFAIDAGRNLINAAVFLVLAVALIGLDLATKRRIPV